ncbi:MAG: hypothetical protein M3Q86_06175 [Verrucomicrobiota bacterium]|nr:hypothetical protein [Verrucomicrobiota bacterium]
MDGRLVEGGLHLFAQPGDEISTVRVSCSCSRCQMRSHSSVRENTPPGSSIRTCRTSNSRGESVIIVRARFQAANSIRHAAERGQDEDPRRGMRGAETGQDRETVEAEQSEVEHDEIGRIDERGPQTFRAIIPRGRLVATAPQLACDLTGQAEIVFDNQDAHAVPERDGLPENERKRELFPKRPGTRLTMQEILAIRAGSRYIWRAHEFGTDRSDN